jgi:pimeloyl-ACP methyl ester carboxylesterase
MPNEWPANQERHGRLLFTSIVAMEPPGWERFARLDIPVLIIHGTQDRNAPYGGGREWAAHLPQARLLTIRSAAHMPWLDAPGLVYPALEEFLRGAWPRAAASVPH